MTDTRKPFDLQAALAGAPVETRSGKKVLKIVDMETASMPLVVKIDGEQEPMLFTREGVYNPDAKETGWDLLMAPNKRVFWVNIYKDGHATIYTSEVTAQIANTGLAIELRAHRVEIDV